MSPIFLIKSNYNYSYIYIHRVFTSVTKLKLFLHEVSFVNSTHISPLRDTLYVCRVKLFAETSELFARALFQLVYKTTSTEFILQGTENMEAGGC